MKKPFSDTSTIAFLLTFYFIILLLQVFAIFVTHRPFPAIFIETSFLTLLNTTPLLFFLVVFRILRFTWHTKQKIDTAALFLAPAIIHLFFLLSVVSYYWWLIFVKEIYVGEWGAHNTFFHRSLISINYMHMVFTSLVMGTHLLKHKWTVFNTVLTASLLVSLAGIYVLVNIALHMDVIYEFSIRGLHFFVYLFILPLVCMFLTRIVDTQFKILRKAPGNKLRSFLARASGLFIKGAAFTAPLLLLVTLHFFLMHKKLTSHYFTPSHVGATAASKRAHTYAGRKAKAPDNLEHTCRSILIKHNLSAKMNQASSVNAAGYSLYKKGLLKEAAIVFRYAARLDPDYVYPVYNLACVLSLQHGKGHKTSVDEIMGLLRTSIALDPDRIKKIMSDPDLDSLRNLKAFALFLEENQSEPIQKPDQSFFYGLWKLIDDDGVSIDIFLEKEQASWKYNAASGIIEFSFPQDQGGTKKYNLTSITNRNDLLFEILPRTKYTYKTARMIRNVYSLISCAGHKDARTLYEQGNRFIDAQNLSQAIESYESVMYWGFSVLPEANFKLAQTYLKTVTSNSEPSNDRKLFLQFALANFLIAAGFDDDLRTPCAASIRNILHLTNGLAPREVKTQLADFPLGMSFISKPQAVFPVFSENDFYIYHRIKGLSKNYHRQPLWLLGTIGSGPDTWFVGIHQNHSNFYLAYWQGGYDNFNDEAFDWGFKVMEGLFGDPVVITIQDNPIDGHTRPDVKSPVVAVPKTPQNDGMITVLGTYKSKDSVEWFCIYHDKRFLWCPVGKYLSGR